MKRVIIVHGWSGSPNRDWMAWLGKELEKKKIQVNIMEMPNSDTPVIESWVSYLEDNMGNLDNNTYFVGHSIGCQTILRVLEKSDKKIGGVLLVAPWLVLNELAGEEKDIASPWIERQINFERVKKRTSNILAIFSDDDPDVPQINIKLFKEKLNPKIIIAKKKGHFNDKKYDIILKEALSLIK